MQVHTKLTLSGPWIWPSCPSALQLCLVLLCLLGQQGLSPSDMMATSSKFNLSTGSSDRPLYTSGQRGSYTSASMERSASFRESTQSSVVASLPNTPRSSSTMSQEDVMRFFQCLRFDPKMLASDLKSNRHGDFKRHLSVALGVSPDSSPSGSAKGKIPSSPLPEEFKRVKAALRESSVKAR